MGVSLSYEFIVKSILLYVEGILFHPPFVFFETSWASALLAIIILSTVSNLIAILCSISLVCSKIGWVDGDGYIWRCGDWVTFFSNVPTRLFLACKEMVLRFNP